MAMGGGGGGGFNPLALLGFGRASGGAVQKDNHI